MYGVPLRRRSRGSGRRAGCGCCAAALASRSKRRARGRRGERGSMSLTATRHVELEVARDPDRAHAAPRERALEPVFAGDHEPVAQECVPWLLPLAPPASPPRGARIE